MKVLALVSGGKDGCYAMLKCKQYGHEICAIANLHPPLERESEEMDSYMFQTVGHSIVKSIATCMGVPFISKTITGTAIKQDLSYQNITKGDEVEDLYHLVRVAKIRWPEIEAVSSGAVLSTYQRLRVEHVCQRLGLVSLGYLWKRDQQDLVEEMIRARIHAIVVKIASMGLKPNMLGKSISQLLPTFQRLNDEFDFHVAGEGGEYETLLLACEGLFLEGMSIELSETSVVMHEDAAFAPVAYLQVKSHQVLQNGEPLDIDDAQTFVDADKYPELTSEETSPELTDNIVTCSRDNVELVLVKGDQGYVFARCQCSVQGSQGIPAAEQIQRVLGWLKFVLGSEEYDCSLKDALFVHLFVSDLADFQAINAEYCKFFGNRPPSRSCVQVQSLPEGCCVAVDLTVVRKSHQSLRRRHVLHVASISEWAPVCIGPYSQCNVVDGLAFCAGQIALDPGSMLLQEEELGNQLSLCFRHCDRVLRDVGSSLQQTANMVVYCEAADDAAGRVAAVGHALDRLLEDLDIGHVPPVAVVAVPKLPRGALVEVEVVGFLEKAPELFDEDSNLLEEDEDADEAHDEVRYQGSIMTRCYGAHRWFSCVFEFGQGESAAAAVMAAMEKQEVHKRARMLMAFYVPNIVDDTFGQDISSLGLERQLVVHAVAVSALKDGCACTIVGRPFGNQVLK